MLHRRNLRDGEGRRRRGRTDQAWKGHENHGDRGSPRLAALGQHPRREPSRSAVVQLCFDFYMIEAKPENLVGDRAYDSDPLDHALRQDGIEMIAPHRSNRTKPPTQDRRPLRRFLRPGWSNASSPGSSGSAGSSSDGNIIQRTSLASFNSPASLSSSGDFEIGSRTYLKIAEGCRSA